MTLFARAGERVYGTRTNARGNIEDFHACTVRHDLFIEELPDFPECLGDWQQTNPPRAVHFVTELVGTATKTTTANLAQHGGGTPPQFGIVWNGESWWRPHDHGHERASMNYDLRFRSPNGTCTWRMDELGNAS